MKTNKSLTNETVKKGNHSEPRPYWHVDAKWIFGILFVVFLGLSLIFYTLTQVTNEKNGKELMTMGLAIMYSGGDLDKTEDFEEAKAKADANGVFCPIANSVFCVNIKDYETLGAREARLKFWGQFAEMIYNEDFNVYAKNPEQKEQIEKDTTFLRIASAKSHAIVKIIFYILFIITLFCLMFLIKFSYKWGKFVSPGIAMIFTTFPGTIILGFLSIIKPPSGTVNPANQGPFGQYAPLASAIIPDIAKIGVKAYLTIFITGIILIIIGFVNKKIIMAKH